MSFKIIQSGSALPVSWPVNPNAEFQPGMIAQLGSFGNNIVCGVSDGTAPIGIIDDIKTRAFSAPAIDEPVIAHVPEIAIQVLNGKYYTTIPIQQTLENSNILEGSIRSNPVDASVNLKNGVLIFPEGTELNLDLNGDGIPDAIRTVVSYSYQVPNIPGDDSTA